MPVAASAIYFLNLRGDVLVNRFYRDDVGFTRETWLMDTFMLTKELGTCPVRQIGGCSFFYMRICNVLFVIVVSSHANVAYAFKFVVEVFLDIVESVNLLMSTIGGVLCCDVTQKILMKCFLSGMPDLKLGLNDKIGLVKESQLKSCPTKRIRKFPGQTEPTWSAEVELVSKMTENKSWTRLPIQMAFQCGRRVDTTLLSGFVILQKRDHSGKVLGDPKGKCQDSWVEIEAIPKAIMFNVVIQLWLNFLSRLRRSSSYSVLSK